MDVHVSLVGRKDLSGEIYRQLRAAIIEGRLRAGDWCRPRARWRAGWPARSAESLAVHEPRAGHAYRRAGDRQQRHVLAAHHDPQPEGDRRNQEIRC